MYDIYIYTRSLQMCRKGLAYSFLQVSKAIFLSQSLICATSAIPRVGGSGGFGGGWGGGVEEGVWMKLLYRVGLIKGDLPKRGDI